MRQHCRNKLVLVVGASGALGREITQKCVAQGYDVIAASRTRPSGLSYRTWVPLDLADEKSIASALRQIRIALDGHSLFAIVNAAGIVHIGNLVSHCYNDLDELFKINAIGPNTVVSGLVDALCAPGGRVIHAGSMSSRICLPFVSAYGASKRALRTFSDAFNEEYGRTGLTSTYLEIGNFRSPLWESVTRGIEKMEANSSNQLGGETMWKLRTSVERRYARAMDVGAVAGVILRVLEIGKPRHCLIVGHDARLRCFLEKFGFSRLAIWGASRVLGLR